MTKFNSCLSATDELQYIKNSDAAPSAYKENAPRQKMGLICVSELENIL